jgi:uncharacterized protein (TIGR01777 family)
MRVFVTGGTGLIGQRLVKQLLERGDHPVVLTRRFGVARQSFGPKFELIEGDPMQPGDWMDAAAGCDSAINLAGENVFNRRWKESFKKLLVDSRILSTRHVVQALSRNPVASSGRPRVLVNASAIGIYGPHSDEELTEASQPGADFLANLCVEWETEALKATTAGIRTAMIRVGVVLDKEGGALAKLLTPFKLFAGGPVGKGKQWMSWIHHADVTGLFLLALDNANATGPINGTSPNPVTNRDFSTALGHALHRPSFMPTPPFALRVLLGEVAEVVTTGQRVLPQRALALGYSYKYPMVDAALTQIVNA